MTACSTCPAPWFVKDSGGRRRCGACLGVRTPVWWDWTVFRARWYIGRSGLGELV